MGRINSSSLFNESLLRKIISESRTYSECLSKFGLRCAGGNFGTLRKYIKMFNIDVSHFVQSRSEIKSKAAKSKIDVQTLLVQNCNFSRSSLKRKLYDSGLKLRKCELCGQTENWNGKKMSLILDHKNGIFNDNRLENLQIVCPNCNATLDTFSGKNKK